MTYFLMLTFIFVTLFAVAVKHLDNFRLTTAMQNVAIAVIWAALGTFFFYNLW